MTLGGSERLRAFLALDLDEPLRARIAETQDRLASTVQDIRWVSPRSLHVTLRFLGHAGTERLHALAAALEPAAAACPPAKVPVGAPGLFPDRGRVRVLWLHLALTPPMLRLQEACERAAVAAGFAPEGRPFRAHLTLGRWREPAARPRLPPVDLGCAALESLVLYRSDLRRGGAVYTPLVRLPLGGGAAGA